jgi:uncharacterized membrane protein
MIAALRSAAGAALGALAALQLLWHGWLAPPRRLPVALVLAVALLPLVPVAIAARRDLRRGLFWGGVVALPYFCHGVMEAWAAPEVRVLAWVELLLAAGIVLAVGIAGLREHRERKAIAAAGGNR